MNGELRRAASVIVGREGVGGLELLVLERSAANRFLPGYVVFPGGAVDAEDAELAERWFGSRDESPRAGAVRELVEEASLALTGVGMVASSSLDLVDDLPPPKEQLVEIAHWVAPERVPVRFDARYFAVEAPGRLEPTPDGHETAAAWWVSPGDLMREWEEGRRALYWPTYFTMLSLATCEHVKDLLALRIETREPDDDEEERLPRSVFWQD